VRCIWRFTLRIESSNLVEFGCVFLHTDFVLGKHSLYDTTRGFGHYRQPFTVSVFGLSLVFFG
jgi:hypothetical protein